MVPATFIPLVTFILNFFASKIQMINSNYVQTPDKSFFQSLNLLNNLDVPKFNFEDENPRDELNWYQNHHHLLVNLEA